ncbi:hypothetical protein CRUP_025990 [Coryphaenoides rupestris]|nr:hypothetical protein CRUP_025990 [Coryphaenoides rupestris]
MRKRRRKKSGGVELGDRLVERLRGNTKDTRSTAVTPLSSTTRRSNNAQRGANLFRFSSTTRAAELNRRSLRSTPAAQFKRSLSFPVQTRGFPALQNGRLIEGSLESGARWISSSSASIFSRYSRAICCFFSLPSVFCSMLEMTRQDERRAPTWPGGEPQQRTSSSSSSSSTTHQSRHHNDLYKGRGAWLADWFCAEPAGPVALGQSEVT